MKKTAQRLRSFRMVCRPEHIFWVENLLRAEGYDCVPEPFSPWCRILTHEPAPLGKSLAALFGCIYIQDRSSMLPPLALNPACGAAILDMCASPGGKTGFCAQLAGPTGFVLANEPNRARLGTLRANMHTLGMLSVGICAYPGEKIPLRPASWKYILLDPPCSGWGTAQKHPEVHTLWRGRKIQPLVALQRRLLEHAALLLAPEGVLVYSTCTTNEDENEAQIHYAREALGLRVEALTPFDGFTCETPRRGGEGTLRVDGAQSAAQGFFIARLRAPAQATDYTAAPLTDSLRLSTLPPQALDGACIDYTSLHGALAVFGESARIVPPHALTLLPDSLQWQAAAVGKCIPGAAGARVRAGARMRFLLPSPPPENALVIDSIATLRALWNGQSVHSTLHVADTGLYWHDLPLGRVSNKRGRIVWNPHV